MESLMQPIDIYCERLAHGFWEEPLNAISNFSFLIAAFLLFRICQSTSKPTPQIKQDIIITLLVALVGVGSFLFHTFATAWGMIADVAGIMIFVHIYLFWSLKRLLGWSSVKSALSIVLFFGLLMLAGRIPSAYSFNGSAAYFPCLLAIVWMRSQIQTPHPATKNLSIAAILLVCSLFFRSIDMALCHLIPMGTHIFWHLINGAVLYYLTKAFIRTPHAHK